MPLEISLSRQVVSSNINDVKSLDHEGKMTKVAPIIFTTDAARCSLLYGLPTSFAG